MEPGGGQPQEGGKGVGHNKHGEQRRHNLLELHLAAPEHRIGENQEGIQHHQFAVDVHLEVGKPNGKRRAGNGYDTQNLMLLCADAVHQLPGRDGGQRR